MEAVEVEVAVEVEDLLFFFFLEDDLEDVVLPRFFFNVANCFFKGAAPSVPSSSALV